MRHDIWFALRRIRARPLPSLVIALTPFALDGRLEVAALKVAPLLPYYGGLLNLAVDDGALDLATDVHVGGTTPDIRR